MKKHFYITAIIDKHKSTFQHFTRRNKYKNYTYKEEKKSSTTRYFYFLKYVRIDVNDN
jgi:hypothetical protein